MVLPLEDLLTEEVVECVDRELDQMESFHRVRDVPRAEATGKVWSTRWCDRRKGPNQVGARFVVRQFATSLDATFHTPTLALDVMRVLLAMGLSKDLTMLFSDISVVFMNTTMIEGDPVRVGPPEGLYENNGMVNSLRDALRLFPCTLR